MRTLSADADTPHTVIARLVRATQFSFGRGRKNGSPGSRKNARPADDASWMFTDEPVRLLVPFEAAWAAVFSTTSRTVICRVSRAPTLPVRFATSPLA